MPARKAIPKKRRFEVFKRDGFACQYCGATPPSVILHIDHIIPVSSGGSNDIDNLITACAPCNLGKSNRPLSKTPESLKARAAEIKEQEDQIAAYTRLLKRRAKRIAQDAWEVIEQLEGDPEIEKYAVDKIASIKRFLGLLAFPDVLEAAMLATERVGYGERAFKYFCGICWKKIRGDSN